MALIYLNPGTLGEKAFLIHAVIAYNGIPDIYKAATAAFLPD
jgi:hypothetical protein